MKALKLALVVSLVTNLVLVVEVLRDRQLGGKEVSSGSEVVTLEQLNEDYWSWFGSEEPEVLMTDPLKVDFGIPVESDYNDTRERWFDHHWQTPPSVPVRLGIPNNARMDS
ncbi:hypothetical protein FEM03_16485 [Phragmitibacter flavus]|uniref:Uncharacterized protein n=1 Tax=Phragmitibacter flavus TaxID=2576071 RepID=A0A5R8KC94_9BACT|nr:hypothetical protein [Phragmitibacter flavus]TLD69555.1 hypothetical protein FEM03_16485 [Phragmitibacter flavus]